MTFLIYQKNPEIEDRNMALIYFRRQNSSKSLGDGPGTMYGNVFVPENNLLHEKWGWFSL